MIDKNKSFPWRIAILLPMMCYSAFSDAQDQIEMADQLRSSGKIYVVLAIILVIFAGLVIYLLMQDRRLMKMEQRFREEKEDHQQTDQ